MLAGVLTSNNYRRSWLFRRCLETLGKSVEKSTVGILGLSYKTGTDSLRRSIAIELIRDLLREGVHVQAFDPKVKSLPNELSDVTLLKTMEDAVERADALVVVTNWPEFSKLTPQTLVKRMAKPVVIDQNGTLLPMMSNNPSIKYITLGRS